MSHQPSIQAGSDTRAARSNATQSGKADSSIGGKLSDPVRKNFGQRPHRQRGGGKNWQNKFAHLLQ